MLIPAISFQGNCENAIKFYQEALDAQVKSIVYASEAPVDSGLDPEMPDDFVMDSEIIIDGQRIMMTDGRLNRPANDFFSFCLVKESADEVTTIFNSLSIDGKVIDPLAPVFWSSLYGMVEDQYGITWMIMTSY
ncbi:VOC family protein [Enterococcus casseliflavus]|uniref:VOC family protein n=1 Tax=Enterococcus casseliflavus TaxID=37734 RepID=UPI003D6C41DF